MSPPTKILPVTERDIRMALKDICKIPTINNILGGMTPFAFDAEGKFHLPKMGIAWVSLIFQSLLQLGHITYYYEQLDVFDMMATSFSPNILIMGERWITVAEVMISTTGLYLLRLVYTFGSRGFVRYHQSLSDLTVDLVLDKYGGQMEFQTYCNQFAEIGKGMRKLGIILMMNVGIGMAILGIAGFMIYHFYLENATQLGPNLSLWKLSILLIPNSLGAVAHGSYMFHFIWFLLYIKWMGVGFSVIRGKSDRLMEKYGGDGVGKNNHDLGESNQHVCDEVEDDLIASAKLLLTWVDQLEQLVREFNSVFQLPMMIWLLTLCMDMIMLLFFTLSAMKISLFDQAGAVLLALGVQIGVLYSLANGGSTFSQNVEEDLGKFCKNISTLLKLRVGMGSQSPTASVLHSQVIMLHNKLQNHPIAISPGNFFTLNRRMMTSVSGLITTYLVVLLQFNDTRGDGSTNSTTAAGT